MCVAAEHVPLTHSLPAAHVAKRGETGGQRAASTSCGVAAGDGPEQLVVEGRRPTTTAHPSSTKISASIPAVLSRVALLQASTTSPTASPISHSTLADFRHPSLLVLGFVAAAVRDSIPTPLPARRAPFPFPSLAREPALKPPSGLATPSALARVDRAAPAVSPAA